MSKPEQHTSPKAATRLEWLKVIRTLGSVPVGRGSSECPPEVATDLEKTGLVRYTPATVGPDGKTPTGGSVQPA